VVERVVLVKDYDQVLDRRGGTLTPRGSGAGQTAGQQYDYGVGSAIVFLSGQLDVPPVGLEVNNLMGGLHRNEWPVTIGQQRAFRIIRAGRCSEAHQDFADAAARDERTRHRDRAGSIMVPVICWPCKREVPF